MKDTAPFTKIVWKDWRQDRRWRIAQALVNYALILSPEKIIVGGGVMNQSHLFPLIREQVGKLLNGYVQHPAFSEDNDSYIVPPALGGNAGLG